MDKVDSEQLQREFDNPRQIVQAIITGVFAKEEENGYGNFEALEEEATQWIKSYCERTTEEAGREKSDLMRLVSCTNCGSENIARGRNKTTVDVNAEGEYRKVVFDYCEDCGEGLDVNFFD